MKLVKLTDTDIIRSCTVGAARSRIVNALDSALGDITQRLGGGQGGQSYGGNGELHLCDVEDR